jgi:hypothetical protein
VFSQCDNTKQLHLLSTRAQFLLNWPSDKIRVSASSSHACFVARLEDLPIVIKSVVVGKRKESSQWP